MNRFQKLLKSLEASSSIPKEDESTYLDYEPRNILADKLNPYLEKLNIELPKMSVADRKRYMEEMSKPENLVTNMGMGRIANSGVFEELAKKFGGTKLNVPKLNEDLSKRIASAFGEMKHDPQNPQVQEAYNALINETLKQYDDLIKSGLKVNKIKGENPYQNSKDLVKKVKESNEISYFPTDEGFGSGAITDNPMLKKTGRFNSDKEEMLANDIFRVVHDIYGHVKPESSFGKVGEEIAYQNHKQMFSPLAQKALATETRGQNSFVNFGPNAEFNRANPAKTIYADQKVGLLPDWAINENAAKPIREVIPTAVTGPTEAIRKMVLEKMANEEE